MNNYECICIVLFPDSNPFKGRVGILNFYLRGLVSKIFKKYIGKNEKILIKNYSNCFLPEKILFYLMKKKDLKILEQIKKDMNLLKINNYFVVFDRKNF